MRKIIHTHSGIFFANPVVVRTAYEAGAQLEFEKIHRNLIRRAYKLMQGTWGWTTGLEFENGKAQVGVGAVLFACPVTWAGYACFTDHSDALQFMMMSSARASRVYIWPARIKFTIHEFSDL